MYRLVRTAKYGTGLFLLFLFLSPSIYAAANEPATRTILDKENKPILIPFNVKRVAPQIGAMAHMTALLGCADRIVCAADANLNDYFKKIFPGYAKANPGGLSTNNVEDVIASGAQVVYGPVRDDAVIAQYKAAGISVVPLNTFSTIEEMKDNIRKIAEILGGEAPSKAEDFCDYYDTQIKYVTEKTSNLSENDYVKILSLSFRGGALSTINATDICSVYINAAGGENVASSLEMVRGISAEDIINWNPEIIITFDANARDQILKEPVLQVVSAVKN
ncbi:MAG: ABC transporter substrate-binding protein, partial [Desulfobacteraceae bacterium]